MLIAVFFAVFAVAIVYSTIGTAETLFLREYLQDASDRSALSDAVMNARSMNLLVLINIVMAALLAVLVTIKLVEALTIIGMAIAAAVAWFFPEALAAIPPLKVIQSAMESAYSAVKPPVYEALKALHTAANAVQDAAPGAADSVAKDDIGGAPVKAGFVATSSRALPVEDDSFSELCGHAGDTAGKLARAALGPAGDALSFLDEYIDGLAHDFSDWFCGDAGSAPPEKPQQLDIAYPRMTWNLACEAEKQPVDLNAPIDKQPHGQKCDESQRKDQEALPDDRTGECRPQFDCTLGSPYDQRVIQARIQCDPSGSPAPFVYKVQQRKGHVTYTWQGKFWKRGDPSYEQPVAAQLDGPPCVSWSRSGGTVRKYNAVVRQNNDVDEVDPLCSNEEPPPTPWRNVPASGETADVEFTEIRHMLGCKKHEQIPIKVTDDKAGGDGGQERSPKRIPEHTVLGSEEFQVRSVVQGDLDSQISEPVVGLTLWNQQAPDEPFPTLRALSGYSTTQAEYFFDDTGGTTAWMWEMSWRARLRRFRMPPHSASTSFLDACSAAFDADACVTLTEKLERVGTTSH